jgi:hypothetical protein
MHDQELGVCALCYERQLHSGPMAGVMLFYISAVISV